MAGYPWRDVLITGAASGLGRALAEACAAPGVTLHLGDLDREGLAEAGEACRARGADVRTAMVDVRQAAAMAAWVGAAGRLDLVIANAGVIGDFDGGFAAEAQTRRIFDTNLTGVLNTVLPAIEAMAAQAPGSDGLRGRIAVIASVMAFLAFPATPAYSASKAAVQRWAEAMDASQRARGIRLHAVCPGFIRTGQIAANPFWMPLRMRPARAARLALEGIAAGRVRVVFPRRVQVGARLIGVLPPGWRSALLGGPAAGRGSGDAAPHPVRAAAAAGSRWRDVLITGASSGLGRALAEACAAPGVTLHLSGRDAGRLDGVAAACIARGATVRPAVLDVTDAAAMAAWVTGAGRLDLVIANAGVSGGTGGLTEPASQARIIFDTNVIGVLNTVLPALPLMAAQAPGADGVRGRVAVIASLAAFVAAPGAPAYCAAKSAVQRWAEALDATGRGCGVRLHAVCPGYVRTPMTARNSFFMPWLMSPERAATRSLAGIAAGRVRVVYPRRLYALARLVGALPPAWRNALMSVVPAKQRSD